MFSLLSCMKTTLILLKTFKNVETNSNEKLNSCQVWENNRGNSRNSRHQVWTYEMLEGTSASAYVLCPFQTLVPRFWSEGDRVSEIGVLE